MTPWAPVGAKNELKNDLHNAEFENNNLLNEIKEREEQLNKLKLHSNAKLNQLKEENKNESILGAKTLIFLVQYHPLLHLQQQQQQQLKQLQQVNQHYELYFQEVFNILYLDINKEINNIEKTHQNNIKI